MKIVLLKALRAGKKNKVIRIAGSRTGISAIILMLWQILSFIKELLDSVRVCDRPGLRSSRTEVPIIYARHLEDGWLLGRFP